MPVSTYRQPTSPQKTRSTQKSDTDRAHRQEQEGNNQHDTRIQVIKMVETAAVPLPCMQKSPETAYMIKDNVLEVHQYGETDTAQNNQQ